MTTREKVIFFLGMRAGAYSGRLMRDYTDLQVDSAIGQLLSRWCLPADDINSIRREISPEALEAIEASRRSLS